MPRVSAKLLAELFRANVLAMRNKEGLIDDAFIAMIMKWRHTSEFIVDNSVRIARDDAAGMTNLAQYIIRSPFSISTAEEFIATITSRTAIAGMAETVTPG